MKMLLVALQLSLTPPVPAPGAESAVSTPQPEKKKAVVIDFEDDDPIDLGPVSSDWECYRTPSRLLRLREHFDDKVMQSVEEMSPPRRVLTSIIGAGREPVPRRARAGTCGP